MSDGPPIDSVLLGIITRTRYLLLDFDGPICDIYAGLSAATVADRLRKLVNGSGVQVPADLARSEDPLDLFVYAAAIDTELAERVEAEMTELEEAATATAKPTGYVHDVFMACRESGRSVAVVSNNSDRAVRSYLTQNGLDDRVHLVVARTSHDAALLKPNPHLIEKALAALGAVPEICAFVGDSTTDIEAARMASVPSIGYANKPGKRASLTDAGADVVISSLADLVLVLRARPLSD
jgi:HAD superfamily hydrolase (TIGR01549 family)